jgi:hypothetical protein
MNPERIKEAIIRLARSKNIEPKALHSMLFDIGCVCDEECSRLEDEYDLDAIPWDDDDIVELTDGFDDGFLPYNDWEP